MYAVGCFPVSLGLKNDMFKLEYSSRAGRGCRFVERTLSAGRHSDIQTACLLCTGTLCKNITPYLQFNEVNWVRVTKPLALPLASLTCARIRCWVHQEQNLKRESRCCINRIRSFLLSFLVSPPQIKWCDGWSQNMLRHSFARYVLVHFSNWKWLEMKNGSETIWFQTSKGQPVIMCHAKLPRVDGCILTKLYYNTSEVHLGKCWKHIFTHKAWLDGRLTEELSLRTAWISRLLHCIIILNAGI